MERRQSSLRRQLNQSFCSPDGSFSISKTIGVFGQIMFLYQGGMHFGKLIEHWDAMLVVALVVTAPELIKQYLKLRLGDGNGRQNQGGIRAGEGAG